MELSSLPKTKAFCLYGLVEEGWVELTRMHIPIENLPHLDSFTNEVLTAITSSGDYALVGNCMVCVERFHAYKIKEAHDSDD